MITTNISEQFGLFIKAAARDFNFATIDEQAAVKFIQEWPNAAEILQKYPLIRTEVKGNRKSIGHDAVVWNHYRNEVEIDLIVPANELRSLCEIFFRSTEHEITSSVNMDSSYFGQEISPLQRVAVDVETTMQRLVMSVEQELSRHQLIKREEQVEAYHDEVIQPKESVKTNEFNAMPLPDVEDWFMQLSTHKSRNGRPFLTENQVHQFIDRAFTKDNDIPKLTVNLAPGERTSITKLFYLFFQRCTNNYDIEPTRQCKEKYVRLLTDNFTNYNYNTVFGTFNNSNTDKKQWKATV